MKLMFLLLPTALVLAGCSTAVQYTDQPMTRLDKDTQYRIDERPGGFAVTVTSSSYTFLAEPAAITAVCRQSLTSLAYDHAEKQGRPIKPINEQRIRISSGYNSITGVTSCSATAPIDWG